MLRRVLAEYELLVLGESRWERKVCSGLCSCYNCSHTQSPVWVFTPGVFWEGRCERSWDALAGGSSKPAAHRSCLGHSSLPACSSVRFSIRRFPSQPVCSMSLPDPACPHWSLPPAFSRHPPCQCLSPVLRQACGCHLHTLSPARPDAFPGFSRSARRGAGLFAMGAG